jgi:hypothetical protein
MWRFKTDHLSRGNLKDKRGCGPSRASDRIIFRTNRALSYRQATAGTDCHVVVELVTLLSDTMASPNRSFPTEIMKRGKL